MPQQILRAWCEASGGLVSGCMLFDPHSVILEGRAVRLEPMALTHVPAVLAAANSPEIFKYLLIPPFTGLEDAGQWVKEALAAKAAETEVPFVTIRRSDNRVVGSTRFIDIRRPHRGLEIGWTWITPEAQRTAINTEAKYLMLKQAFEGWGALRVQLKTDANNAQSRAAILRLGAKFEGVLRKQLLRAHDGYQRDTAMFSITDVEWPGVKAGIEKMLAR